jgi:hypothetical protein
MSIGTSASVARGQRLPGRNTVRNNYPRMLAAGKVVGVRSQPLPSIQGAYANETQSVAECRVVGEKKHAAFETPPCPAPGAVGQQVVLAPLLAKQFYMGCRISSIDGESGARNALTIATVAAIHGLRLAQT